MRDEKRKIEAIVQEEVAKRGPSFLTDRLLDVLNLDSKQEKPMVDLLDGRSTYLAGPIEFADDGGFGWRNDITPWLENMFNIEVLDPNYKSRFFHMDVYNEGDCDEYLDELCSTGKFDELSEVMSRKIAHPDLRLVDKADFLICRFLKGVVSVGTLDEAFKAKDQKKPVIWFTDCRKEEMPYWMFHRFDHNMWFNSVDDIYGYLRDVDSGFLSEYELGYWCL